MTPIETIAAYEIAGRMMSPRNRETGRERITRMRAALEAAGVEFTDGDDLDVTLRKSD